MAAGSTDQEAESIGGEHPKPGGLRDGLLELGVGCKELLQRRLRGFSNLGLFAGLVALSQCAPCGKR